MTQILPSFHIDVTEEAIQNGKNLIHRMAINTSRICKELNPEKEIMDTIKVEKINGAIPENVEPKVYYSRMAGNLSLLDNQQLLDNFSGIRVCFKFSRLEKKYEFRFEY